MASFVQNGDKVRITIGTSIYDYNLREVDYTHNGTTITVETDGYTRHNIAYLDVTSPSSTDIQNLIDQLNAYKLSINANVDTTGLATQSKQDDIITELTGSQRNISTVEATTAGSTTAGVQSVSLLFDGNGGTLNGVSVPNKYFAGFSPNGTNDTVNAISYTPPTTSGGRIIITYVL